MSWFWTFIFLAFTVCTNLSETKHQNKLPSAVVVGTVYCNSCFEQNSPNTNHFIAGASVEAQCNRTRSGLGFRQDAKTNSRGEFKIRLPFPVSNHVRNIRGCSVRLLRSNNPSCAVATSATSSSFHLKPRKDGARIFSAGVFSFKPQVCNSNVKKETDQLPFLPNPLNPPSIFPPNPLQPPPSVIPPILPTPPPSIVPPIFPAPPTPPFFSLPPIIPGLVPSPPPPTPPTFPIPLPPFPFQPTPGFPGVPPAEVNSRSRTGSP